MRDLGQILVVDIESTCWDDEPPSGELSEIIEVGIVVLDSKTLDIVDKNDIIVRPEHSQVSRFCTHLTGITQDLADGGVSFKDACSVIKGKFQPKEKLWASWGDYDRRQFERCCKESDAQYPFGIGHLNVKTLFAFLHDLDAECAMDQALNRINLPLEGRHHRGVDDAGNIAKILAHMLKKGREALRR